MHPLAIMGIIAGGLIVCWGGYEAIQTLYEWHNDRKEEREYQEYVRKHTEKGRFSGVPVYEYHDDTDNEDNEPLGIWKQKRDSINSQNELRHRNVSSSYNEKSIQNSMNSSTSEFCEMEKSISERKSFLERESEILQKEEAELERRRSIIQSKGNSITGVFNDDSDHEQQNPFADSFIEQQQQLNSSQCNSFVGSIFEQVHHENPFADDSLSEQRNDDGDSNKSSLSSHNGNNSVEHVVFPQQELEAQYQLLHEPVANSTSDLEGSWSDLNEDMLEVSSDGNHYRDDSTESFQHIDKH